MYAVPNQDLIHVWEKAARCLPLLANSRFFITGGTGFFGCWLVDSLVYAVDYLQLKTDITVLTRDPNKFLKKNPHLKNKLFLHFIEGDVKNFNFPAGKFTHVIHAATEASAQLNQENPLLMLDTIVAGTRRTLEFAVQANVKKFLFVSSGAVYGKQPTTMERTPETYIGVADPLTSQSAYGLGKLMAEHVCLLFAKQHGLHVKIARCFAFVGPHLPLDIHFAIGNFIRNALNQEPINIMGDGSPYRSYLYAADLVVWLLTILCLGEVGRAYNVGSEETISIAELAHVVSAQLTPALTVNIAKPRDANKAANNLAERYVPSTQRAQCELALQQWITLADGIKRTMAFYR